MQIFTDEYEITFHAEQSDIVQLTHGTTGDTLHITLDEAVGWLQLMLTHSNDLHMLKTGNSINL
ncbi:MAG TPA: hypothetical protein VGN34_17985 [Ktedonobacteraceae bacterium]|jgi:hypothetical protein